MIKKNFGHYVRTAKKIYRGAKVVQNLANRYGSGHLRRIAKGFKVERYIPQPLKNAYKKYNARPKRHRTRGTYKGKFPRGKKGSNITNVSVYANKGILRNSEVRGLISDPDCVYISHTAGDNYKIIQVTVIALMRKLFQKKGIVIANIDTPIPNLGIGNAVDFKVELTKVDGYSGNETVLTTYNTIATDSLRVVSGNFEDAFMRYSSGYDSGSGAGNSNNDLNIIYNLNLYQFDYRPASITSVLQAQIHLADEIMHVYACSEMKIQNRTLAADSSTDETDVTNNPLIGRSYEFKKMPLTRDKVTFQLNKIPVNDGVQLVRASDVQQQYKEPPDPSIFVNCVRSAKLHLEPGHIKSSKIMYKKSHKLLEFLRQINLQYGGTGLAVYHTQLPCEIIALEDIINVQTTSRIQVAYETNQVVGVYLTTTNKAHGVMQYDAQRFDNNPA